MVLRRLLQRPFHSDYTSLFTNKSNIIPLLSFHTNNNNHPFHQQRYFHASSILKAEESESDNNADKKADVEEKKDVVSPSTSTSDFPTDLSGSGLPSSKSRYPRSFFKENQTFAYEFLTHYEEKFPDRPLPELPNPQLYPDEFEQKISEWLTSEFDRAPPNEKYYWENLLFNEKHEETKEQIEYNNQRLKKLTVKFLNTMKYFADGGKNKIDPETGDYLFQPNLYMKWTWPKEWHEAEKLRKHNPLPHVPKTYVEHKVDTNLMDKLKPKEKARELGIKTEYQFGTSLFKAKMSDVRRIYKAEYETAVKAKLEQVKHEWATTQFKKSQNAIKKLARKESRAIKTKEKEIEFERERQVRRELWRRNRIVSEFNRNKLLTHQIAYIRKEKEEYWLDNENKVTENLFTTESKLGENSIFDKELIGFWPKLPEYELKSYDQRTARKRHALWDLTNFNQEMNLDNYEDNGARIQDNRNEDKKYATVQANLAKHQEMKPSNIIQHILEQEDHPNSNKVQQNDSSYWINTKEDAKKYSLSSQIGKEMFNKRREGYAEHLRKTPEQFNKEKAFIVESMKLEAKATEQRKAMLRTKLLAQQSNPLTESYKARNQA